MISQQKQLVLAVALVAVCLTPVSSNAITPYSQDFESLIQTDINALAADGWKVFGNVYTPLGVPLYGYGAFIAPNDGAAFCQIDIAQGGVEQGFQQLAVFSDYNNLDHAAGNIIEANVFQEQDILLADVGTTWKFSFETKLGNLLAPSEGFAFIKTIDPGAGYATTNFVVVDLTATPVDWTDYSLMLPIDAGLVGQFIQIGFYSTATFYESSALFYDNIVFESVVVSAVPDSPIAGIELGQNYPNPFNPSTRIEFSLDKTSSVELTVYDIAGRKVATLHQGSLGAGSHQVNWNGKTDAGAAAPTGRYSYVLRTPEGQTARSMILLK